MAQEVIKREFFFDILNENCFRAHVCDKKYRNTQLNISPQDRTLTYVGLESYEPQFSINFQCVRIILILLDFASR